MSERPAPQRGHVVLVMGVAGSGKTTIGARLAEALGWPFLDADELHSRANRERMAAGIPLDDAARQPWLRRVRRRIDEHCRQGRSVVVACSALRESYRRVLLQGCEATHDTHVVHLTGSPALLAERLRARRGHFFPPELLSSQLETLELPSDALAVDIADDVETLVQRIREALHLERA